MLPIGPRKHTAEELDQSRLGGGFRLYGYDREGSEGIPIGKLLPLVPTRLMIGVQLRKHRLVMVLKEGGREVKGEVFSPIPSLKLMNLIIGQRMKLLYPLLVEDLIGDGVLGQTVVILIRIGGWRFASGGGAFDTLRERRGGLLGLWGGLWVYGSKEWSNR
ncbi:hypothetical protein R3W88_011036 [Solanum pinnatisectum]|uniref:Uncharacterized protein n=1 Tax=Solanum pinnatisectum TaxID=50273 RepID=A0AAV9L5L6_9SOLN|nr:hypothetical protein R3W88_011036 [Solanum pinnatisectum]